MKEKARENKQGPSVSDIIIVTIIQTRFPPLVLLQTQGYEEVTGFVVKTADNMLCHYYIIF